METTATIKETFITASTLDEMLEAIDERRIDFQPEITVGDSVVTTILRINRTFLVCVSNGDNNGAFKRTINLEPEVITEIGKWLYASHKHKILAHKQKSLR